ncbi:MAG: hypothetical protein J2P21_20125 [Chloracidobacterium sp.]|nr:hypothetical protein [Chloracidobacterium sp.]
MMNGTSSFFANFSLRKLVNDKLNLPAATYPGASLRGGGGGFTVGGQSICHKSESFTCPIYASDFVSFDEQGFVTSIKAEIEKEMINLEVSINRQGKIDGDFNSSEFYLEYSHGEIKGRIVISGKMIASGYYLSAYIEEIIKGGEFPVVTTQYAGAGPRAICGVSGGVGLPFAPEGVKWAIPEGDYFAVLFSQDDPLAQDHKFLRRGYELLNESRNRIPPGVKIESDAGFKYVEVLSLYDTLYFMNEAALQMYREGGIEIETLKKIPIPEIPKRCNRILGGPYFPGGHDE